MLRNAEGASGQVQESRKVGLCTCRGQLSQLSIREARPWLDGEAEPAGPHGPNWSWAQIPWDVTLGFKPRSGMIGRAHQDGSEGAGQAANEPGHRVGKGDLDALHGDACPLRPNTSLRKRGANSLKTV